MPFSQATEHRGYRSSIRPSSSDLCRPLLSSHLFCPLARHHSSSIMFQGSPVTIYKSSLFLLPFRPTLEIRSLCHRRPLRISPILFLRRLLPLEAMKGTSTSCLATPCLRRHSLLGVFQVAGGRTPSQERASAAISSSFKKNTELAFAVNNFTMRFNRHRLTPHSQHNIHARCDAAKNERNLFPPWTTALHKCSFKLHGHESAMPPAGSVLAS